MGWGSSLVVLGLECCCDEAGFTAQPEASKAAAWSAVIDQALADGVLLGGRRQWPGAACAAARLRSAGLASKMAGRLAWASCHMFRRVGRSMLRPLFEHSRGRSKRLGEHTAHALAWWRSALALHLAECKHWDRDREDPPVLVLVDARGTPPRLAAIIISESRFEWTELAPPACMLGRARSRGAPPTARRELRASAGSCTRGGMRKSPPWRCLRCASRWPLGRAISAGVALFSIRTTASRSARSGRAQRARPITTRWRTRSGPARRSARPARHARPPCRDPDVALGRWTSGLSGWPPPTI